MVCMCCRVAICVLLRYSQRLFLCDVNFSYCLFHCAFDSLLIFLYYFFHSHFFFAFYLCFFFFNQKTAYDMRISDWSSDVCSSDLLQQDSSFCPSGPSGDQSQSALNCVIFTANALGVARCRADQMAAEDLRELHHASQQLRLYTVQATDQFSRQEIGRASCRERGCQSV